MPVTETRTIPEDAIKQPFSREAIGNQTLDYAKATALALLMQPAGMGAASAGEFLAEVDDGGISRPLVDYEAITQSPCLPAISRAAKSLSPMQLSQQEAASIDQSLRQKSARTRFPTSRLPEMES